MNDTLAWQDTDTTVRQMRSAPIGAIYIWPDDNLTKPKTMSRELNRADLYIVGPSIFDKGGHRLLGYCKCIVLDHATKITEQDHCFVAEHNARHPNEC